MALSPTSSHGSSSSSAGSKLYDFTISGADQASIDTNVDGTTVASFAGFDLLEAWMILRTDDVAATAVFNVTLNNDGGANYDRMDVGGTNAAVAAGNALAQTSFAQNCHGSGGTASYPSSVSLAIPGYAATTFFKVGEFRGAHPDGTAANNRSYFDAVGYRSTSAITRIKVAASGAAKLKIGSRLIVYAR